MFAFLKKTEANYKPLPEPHYFHDMIGSNNPYLRVYTHPLNMISVFDDLRFDRSDIDNLSPGMYRYINSHLVKHGFKRLSGRVFEHSEFDLKCIIPQTRVQGSSPFHVLDYTSKRVQDFYILTPTQIASALINNLSHEQAVPYLVELSQNHPFNMFKLKDHIESNQQHQDFLNLIPHLKYQQREAVSKPPLKRLRALK